jgi:hypothetical protein
MDGIDGRQDGCIEDEISADILVRFFTDHCFAQNGLLNGSTKDSSGVNPHKRHERLGVAVWNLNSRGDF